MRYWLLVQVMRVALWLTRRECPDYPRNLLSDAMGDAGWYARPVQPLPEQIERELVKYW